MESSEQTPAPPAQPASDGAPDAQHQAPVATENQKVITGDPGFGEQQPRVAPANMDMPLATSSPPPQAQSGMPLPEDRARAAQEHAGGEQGGEGASAEGEEHSDAPPLPEGSHADPSPAPHVPPDPWNGH